MHLCERRHRVRLSVYPRSCPLHGLKTSRYRGAWASTLHQGRSEFHRHRNQVLKPLRVSSLQLGTNLPNLVQVRFLINESHYRYTTIYPQGAGTRPTELVLAVTWKLSGWNFS